MKYLIPIFLLLAVTSCMNLDLPEEVQSIEASTNLDNLVVPADFEFETTQSFTFSTTLFAPDGRPLKGAPISVFSDLPEKGGNELMNGFTDASGVLEVTLDLPTYMEKVYFTSDYIGVVQEQEVTLQGKNITFEWGEHPVELADSDISTDRIAASQSYTFHYMGGFNNKGLPDYLEADREVIDQDFLTFVNANLPERRPVHIYNPDYIADGLETDVKLTQDAEVYITFVHEGAGYKNSMGFYTYDLNNPPQSPDDIDSLKMIFPNLSYPGAGSMVSGQKVKLGSFSANTGIGWFLVPDGWKTNKVEEQPQYAKRLKFSNPAFNTFTSGSNRSHMVVLKDRIQEIVLIGWEDISRPGGDKDFNDAIFYVTTNNFSAFDLTNVISADGDTEDADLDGIPDIFDYAATNSFVSNVYRLPAANVFGTLTFEDFWPSKGDYDFNDLVLDYNYELKVNSNNKVTEIDATFIVRAIGAGYHNGFGFVLNTAPESIGSVEGQRLISPNKIKLASNGVESGQSKAVIIVFDDAYGVLRNPDYANFINTQPGVAYVEPETVDIKVTLSEPVLLADLLSSGFNPFIFTGRGRGYEIHLPGQQPTDLADATIMGTGDDASDGVSTFYQTSNGMPWAMNFPNSFSYPFEQKRITTAYNHFLEWAESGGTRRAAWYLDQTGFRNTANIYSK
ncbi:MAG: LruC domain-containing protein [Bacteroidota bacterium]